MGGLKASVLFRVQVAVLHLSYGWHRIVRRGRPADIDWVVGPFEIASLVHHIAASVPGARSYVLARHRFYDFAYDWSPSTRRYPGAAVLRAWLLGPAKLGELAVRARGFVYVSAEGFLNAGHDQRHHEFAFLARRGRKIVCYFTGNDIRSPRLMKELERETGRPNLGTYLADTNPVFATDAYDAVKRRIADAANRYADAVFNADVDQRGYLARPSLPFLYFQPDALVAEPDGRFDGDGRLVVVHAPSSPIIKGTPLVRAAVQMLRDEGRDFEYIELIGVTNDVVLQTLGRAHVALNEFYSSVPGVFGVEAMAAGCALITSADENDEPQLPTGSNEAWLVTPHHRIADSLRALLDDRDRARALAASGQAWVRAHAVSSASASVLATELDRLLDLPARAAEPT